MTHIYRDTRAARQAQEAERLAKNPPKPKKPELEADIQRKIIALLKRRGAVVTRVNSGHMRDSDGRHIALAAAGTSDLICLYRSRYLALEIKRPGNKPTSKQQAFLEDVRREGGIAMVLTSVAEAEALLDAIKGDAP